MTGDRPYRPSMTQQAALDELLAGAGIQFDPDVVDVFIRLMGGPKRVAAHRGQTNAPGGS
jgi:HD-GYP domain-containing protein (c-di-GMP phosphodiesterase class II)